jgi:SET domain-containing protein
MPNDKRIQKDSHIEGRGLFADRDFKEGEVLAVFSGPRISAEEAESIYQGGSDYILQVSNDAFIDLAANEARYINHSCDPNAAFIGKPTELIALRPIKAGEEIHFDYSANENTEFKMLCRCGSPICRRVIVPYAKLSESERDHIHDIVSPYLKVSK